MPRPRAEVHAGGDGWRGARGRRWTSRAFSLPSCLWSVGFAVFIVGNVLDFLALGLTKVSIVTLVGSGSLVVNTVIDRVRAVVLPLLCAAAALLLETACSPWAASTSGWRDDH